MKPCTVLAGLCLSGIATAVEMTHYSAQTGVEPAFEAYLKARRPSSDDRITNFFVPQGKLIVLGNTAVGAEKILALKQELLPTAGTKHWNHLPNVTSVESETTAQKVYKVLGVIESTYDGKGCSKAYYSSRFPVKKGANGAVDLTPHTGNLIAYDDFVVNPAVSPTDIPCDA